MTRTFSQPTNRIVPHGDGLICSYEHRIQVQSSAAGDGTPPDGVPEQRPPGDGAAAGPPPGGPPGDGARAARRPPPGAKRAAWMPHAIRPKLPGRAPPGATAPPATPSRSSPSCPPAAPVPPLAADASASAARAGRATARPAAAAARTVGGHRARRATPVARTTRAPPAGRATRAARAGPGNRGGPGGPDGQGAAPDGPDGAGRPGRQGAGAAAGRAEQRGRPRRDRRAGPASGAPGGWSTPGGPGGPGNGGWGAGNGAGGPGSSLARFAGAGSGGNGRTGNGALTLTGTPRPPLLAPSRLMEYLPTLYQGDDFLGRFLRIFEDIIDPIERTIDNVGDSLDPRLAPDEFLPWLSSWMGADLDENWPPAKQRELIASAATLYRWRGTRRGLREHLRIYTGFSPLIVENFTGLRLGQDAVLGVNTRLGEYPPHCFYVTAVRRSRERSTSASCSASSSPRSRPTPAICLRFSRRRPFRARPPFWGRGNRGRGRRRTLQAPAGQSLSGIDDQLHYLAGRPRVPPQPDAAAPARPARLGHRPGARRPHRRRSGGHRGRRAGDRRRSRRQLHRRHRARTVTTSPPARRARSTCCCCSARCRPDRCSPWAATAPGSRRASWRRTASSSATGSPRSRASSSPACATSRAPAP